MPERICVSCSWVVCLRLKDDLVYSVLFLEKVVQHVLYFSNSEITIRLNSRQPSCLHSRPFYCNSFFSLATFVIHDHESFTLTPDLKLTCLPSMATDATTETWPSSPATIPSSTDSIQTYAVHRELASRQLPECSLYVIPYRIVSYCIC